MPARLFDFQCGNGHTTERFVDVETKLVRCEECGEDANRIISPVSHKIDSWKETRKWAKQREQKIKLERKATD